MTTGVDLISFERFRQQTSLGWTDKHDDQHKDRELSRAAACYALHDENMAVCEVCYGNVDDTNVSLEHAWPSNWDPKWDKRNKHDRIKRLVIAGALIAAEIDRCLRMEK